MMKMCLKRSLPVTSGGFAVMIPKQSDNLHNESCRPRRDRKKLVKVGVMLRRCRLFFFFILQTVLYTMNVLQEVRRSTRNFTLIFYKDCVTQCKGASGDWFLRHDNAPTHSSNLVQKYLVKHKITQLRQPPYSPDIGPCDFCLFSKWKIPLKERRFDGTETIRTNATSSLKAIAKADIQNCFGACKHGWEHVIQSNGDHFEGFHEPDEDKYDERGITDEGRLLLGQTLRLLRYTTGICFIRI